MSHDPRTVDRRGGFVEKCGTRSGSALKTLPFLVVDETYVT